MNKNTKLTNTLIKKHIKNMNVRGDDANKNS